MWVALCCAAVFSVITVKGEGLPCLLGLGYEQMMNYSFLFTLPLSQRKIDVNYVLITQIEGDHAAQIQATPEFVLNL